MWSKALGFNLEITSCHILWTVTDQVYFASHFLQRNVFFIFLVSCTWLQPWQEFLLHLSLSSQVKCPLNSTSDKVWKKLKLCIILEASCAGEKVDCPRYCVGLCNFAPNKIFGLPLLIKIWNDNLANLLLPIMYVQTKLSLITNCLPPNSSKRGECYLCN